MRSYLPRKGLLIFAGTIGVFLVAAAVAAIALFNPRLTRYVEGDAFREALETETAKGLHFPRGYYSPIRRTGFLTGQSESFRADKGEKALKSLEARGLTVKFNPWAVFLRRWQFDEISIRSTEVEIQIYEHHPEPAPVKPWSAVFLPKRVYLKSVGSDSANITWRFRGERAGFFGTRLLITPRGPDFNYQATGGSLKMAPIPDLSLRHIHLLITKTLLNLYDVDLTPVAQSEGTIRGEGTAGIGQDKSVNFKANFDRVPIGAWLPASWKEHLTGSAFGNVHWQGTDTKLENSSGEGSLRVADARLENLPFLEKLPQFARKKSLEHLQLNDCALDVAWRYPKIDIKNIVLEEKGKFRIEGAIWINHASLGGTIELGVAREYLGWLPKPEEIFTRKNGGYLWTTVHLSGTVYEPKQDLSPRIIDLFKESPGAYLSLLFREFGDWLRKIFGGD